MSIRGEIERFTSSYGRDLTVGGAAWRYYRLGSVGTPVLWLPGGLRRAAVGYAFLERLAERHTVITPDYPPVLTMAALAQGLDAILQREGVRQFALGGQSYGGVLAQAYLALRKASVTRQVLSSTGPADFGKAWLLGGFVANTLVRWLRLINVKELLLGRLVKAQVYPPAQRDEWLAVLDGIIRNELTRADLVSHFAVVADIVRRGMVRASAYTGWAGQVAVLRAANDPTQKPGDLARYHRLFGRAITLLDLGTLGHAAALAYPETYTALVERALAAE